MFMILQIYNLFQNTKKKTTYIFSTLKTIKINNNQTKHIMNKQKKSPNGFSPSEDFLYFRNLEFQDATITYCLFFRCN